MRRFSPTQLVQSLVVTGIISAPFAALAQDAEFNSQHGLALIKADEAYAQGFTGKGVIVGLVDSGIDSDHPEFYGRLLSGFDLTTGKVILPQSGNTDLPDYDEHGQIEDEGGHGTHVSGTIAANKDGKGMHGVAYDSQIFMVKPFNEIEKLGKAFIVAAQYRPKIINLSLGLNNCDADGEGGEFCNISDYTQQDVLNNQIESSALEGLRALHEKGILVVAATGNESQPSSDVLAGMPYLFNELKENSLAVTAVNQFRELADYSNKCGVAAEWCLSAPGGDEIEEKDYIEWINSTLPGGGYGNPEMMGTSMATPHVVGVAALVAEAFPYFSANNLQQTILTTATPLGDRNVYGWGLVNAGKAVKGPAQFIDVFHADTQGVDSVFLNDISGDGVLFKTGQGRLELPGQNTFSLVFAEKGELAITGTHANRVFADRNARLSGDGQIGDVVVAGVIAPGVAEKNPFGQLTILDSFVAQAEAVLEITTSIDGQSSGLHLNGVSQIDNMHIALKGDAFRPGVYYTVLDGNSDILGGANQLTGAKTTFLEGVIDR